MIVELGTKDMQAAIRYWYINCDDAPSAGEVEAIKITQDSNGNPITRLRMKPTEIPEEG